MFIFLFRTRIYVAGNVVIIAACISEILKGHETSTNPITVESEGKVNLTNPSVIWLK